MLCVEHFSTPVIRMLLYTIILPVVDLKYRQASVAGHPLLFIFSGVGVLHGKENNEFTLAD